MSFLSRTLRSVIIGGQIAATYHLIVQRVGQVQMTEGPSMLPTLNTRGDGVLINCLYRRGRGVKAGDLVSFRHPLLPGARGSKRVLGLEGDFVLCGEKGGESMIQVPEGHVWVAGDNLDWSRDSRDYGPMPMALIIGKVEARVWPLREAKWLRGTFNDVES